MSLEGAPDSPPLTPEQEKAPYSAALTPENEKVPDSPPLTPEEEEAPNSPPPTPENLTLKPPIWSVFRGGIYETLPYYRAYKGGLYTKDLLAKGFLIDRQKEVRDFLGAQVVITSL
jgi:hypothetical protein